MLLSLPALSDPDKPAPIVKAFVQQRINPRPTDSLYGEKKYQVNIFRVVVSLDMQKRTSTPHWSMLNTRNEPDLTFYDTYEEAVSYALVRVGLEVPAE